MAYGLYVPRHATPRHATPREAFPALTQLQIGNFAIQVFKTWLCLFFQSDVGLLCPLCPGGIDRAEPAS